MIGNNTAIKEVWSRLGKKFDQMFEKRAHVHWFYDEGMIEGDFLEARENLASMEQDYDDLVNVSGDHLY